MVGDTIGTALIEKALDGLWQRQKVIANNIANQETPGFKARNVSFEQQLKKQVEHLKSFSKHEFNTVESISSIRDSKISINVNRSFSERADGNSVNMELENIQMAKAQIQYQFLTRTLTDYYSRLRYAISEGKR